MTPSIGKAGNFPRIKIFKGHWGCDNKYLVSPTGKFKIRMPSKLASILKNFLDKFSWLCITKTCYLFNRSTWKYLRG